MMNRNDALISVITPVLNEQKTIKEFYDRITKTFGNSRFELIFVDDGSNDDSWEIIAGIAKTDPRVCALRLSRNFGHQAALTAGLEQSKGDAVILIDSDLQDPPEVIPEMIKKWKDGFDVVYGVRSQRKGEGFFKKITATVFYKLIRKVSNMSVPLEAGDFRLLSRTVVNILNNIPEKIRFLRGLTSWVGFKQIGVNYSREQRFAGQTKFSVFRMVKFAFDGITSFSTVPLQLASYLGLIVTSVSLLVALQALYVRFVTHTAVTGWASLLIIIVFLGGVQLLMIGVIGEYLGRIYEEVKNRPVYLVSEKIERDNVQKIFASETKTIN